MSLLSIFALSGLINGLVVLGFGIFVISHNWRDKLNRLYLLIVIAICIWSFSYWKWLSSNDAFSALFWVRMLSIGSTLIPVFYLHWVLSILKIEKQKKTSLWMVYILSFLFILFSFSDLYISSVEEKLFFPFWPNPGILYHIYLFILYICIIIYSSYLLLKGYMTADGEDKKRLAYVLTGAVIAFAGGLTNFFLWYDIPIAPYGNFLVVFYPLLFGYATIRYKLFNIKVVTTELFTIAIWIFLFIKVLISSDLNDLIVNLLLFIAVVIFGISLIISMLREIRQREQIEKLAKEIQGAYEIEKQTKEQTEKAYELEKKAKEELQALDKAKNQFLLTIQHHLRTPLTSMMGYADLILKGVYGKQNKKTTEVIQKFDKSTATLIKMVNEFLDITQFQLGKEVVLLKPDVRIDGILEEIISELKFVAESKKIHLKLGKLPELPPVKADPEKLRAALYNIFDNAIKYTQKGGVDIKISNSPNILITVKDTGIGMSADGIRKLFNTTFERGELAKKTFVTGRGIGLYISGQIIKAHNGKVWAESPGEGKGSTFYIELPVQ